MDPVVFLGPTMPVAEARSLLAADYRPPARMGSVFRAVRDGASVVAVVDGYYERVPAVWHKEIVWALSAGVRVYGASSMGALRAAELRAFGMIGVGEIYRWYRDGVVEDDDEVALFHAPAAGGYRPVSEPLVNIRATLTAAAEGGVIAGSTAGALVALAKSSHYPDRGYRPMLAAGARQGLPADELAALEAWLPTGRVDQKRLDAAELLRRIAAGGGAARPAAPFEPTWIWRDLVLALGRD